MRKVFAILVLVGACGSPATPPAPVTETIPTPVAAPEPALPAWPTPVITRAAERVSAVDRLTVSVAALEDGAHVELRVARGPIPATCDDAHEARTLDTRAGGGFESNVDPDASATVCVRDRDGHVRATATSPGFRTVPGAYASSRDGQVLVEHAFEPLDDDVTAVVIVSREDTETAIPALGCRTMASAQGDQDDPPERCEYDCASEHVVLEIPRAAWDAVLASPAFHDDPDDADDLLYPPTIGAAYPVTIPGDHDAIEVCVRTRSGSVVADDSLWTTIASGPWDGCAFETIAGCLGMPSSFGDLARGDVLLGATEDGTVVRAPVRTARTRARPSRDVETTRGMLSVLDDARVRGADGSDVIAGDIAPGTTLWTRHGAATVRTIERHDDGYGEPTVDLEGAVYFLSSGFAVRDDGGPETTTAPTHADEPLALEGGDGDCALQAQWEAARTPSDVVVRVTALAGHDRHASRDGTCGAAARPIPAARIDAPTLAAIASIAPGARVQVQLYGSAVECGSDYWVSRCDASDTTAIGASLSWLASPQCVPVGTPIDTPHGAIAIEKLERGDEVTSYDPRGGLGTARVLGTTTHAHRAIVAATLDDGTVLRATPDHVVMVGMPPRETAMSTLVVGDVLTRHVGERVVPARVIALATDGTSTVVELRVTSPDTYFASGVLVHNY